MKNLVRLFCLINFISWFCWILFIAVPSQAVSSFQRSISISNTSGVAQTNFQISVVLDTQSLILASKMRSDCGDIRFLTSNGITFINNYWVDGCNSTTTRIWVKVPNIPTGNSTILLRYGDPDLTSLSSGINTMERFETMTSAPTCTLRNSATYDAVNDWVQLTPAVGGLSGQCEYNYNPGQGFYSKFEFQIGGSNPGADAAWLYAYQRTTPTAEDIIDRGYHFTFDEYQDRICFTRSTTDNGPCLVSGTNTTIDNNQWRTAEIFHSNRLATMSLDGVNFVNGSDTSDRVKTNNLFGFAARTGGVFAYHRIRLIVIARFLTAVTATLNSEAQINANLSMSIRNSADTSNINICDLGLTNPNNLTTCSYRLKIVSDAVNGYTISVRTSGDLINAASDTISNATAGSGGGGGTDISSSNLGIERYGAVISTGSITGTGTINRTTAYNAGLVNAVNFANTTSQSMVTSTGKNFPSPTDTLNTILITHKLNIAVDTPSGNYTQAITYTIIPNF